MAVNKKIIIEKNSIYSIVLYIFVSSIILEANSIYSQIYGIHIYIRTALIITSLLSGIFIIKRNRKAADTKVDKRILSYLILSVICGLLMLLRTDNANGYGIIAMIILGAFPIMSVVFACCDKKTFRDILEKFVNVVILLSILSLIMWVLSSIFHAIEPTSQIKVIWGKPYSLIDTYGFIHFDTQSVWWITGAPLIRNTGIFTEGPMYAFILVLALLFNNLILFKKQKKYIIRSIIIAAAILTTISATGVLCAVIIFIMSIKKYFMFMSKKAKPVFALLLLTVLITAVPLMINIATKKLDTSSSMHRSMDVNNGLQAFSKKPLLGNGINHDRGDEYNPETGYGYSNTVIPVMTDGGIVLSALYFLPFLLLLINVVKSRSLDKIGIVAVYSIIMITTLAPYRLALVMLIVVMMRLSTERLVSNGVEDEE